MDTQAKIIVVGNKKGGAGKTTFSIHAAGTLHRYGKKVLLIEQDTQGSILPRSHQRTQQSGMVEVSHSQDQQGDFTATTPAYVRRGSQ